MNYELLNNIVDYIEENLTNELDYKKLSKRVGINDFILQRVFNIMCGVSISDYTRKRRLSCAYEELKLTSNKIIDIAIKYGYESSISFARSFKKEFGITPKQVRNNNINFKIFPRYEFKDGYKNKNIINYRIEKINSFDIYGVITSSSTKKDIEYKIRELYKKIKSNKLYDLFNNNERYGLSFKKNNKYYYVLGSKKEVSELTKITIESNEYAIFEVGSNLQTEILSTIKYIKNIWYNSKNISIKENMILEYYSNNNCYIYIPIKRNKINI